MNSEINLMGIQTFQMSQSYTVCLIKLGRLGQENESRKTFPFETYDQFKGAINFRSN